MQPIVHQGIRFVWGQLFHTSTSFTIHSRCATHIYACVYIYSMSYTYICTYIYVGCIKCYCFHTNLLWRVIAFMAYQLNVVVATCCVTLFTFLYSSQCFGVLSYEVVCLEFGKYSLILDRG